MKRFTIKFMLLLCGLVLGSGTVWADDQTTTFAPRNVTGTGNLADNDGNTWAFTSDAAGFTSSASYVHAGSGSKSVSHITFTTSAFSEVNIKKIQVWAAAKASTGATTKIKIGSTLLGTSNELSNTVSSGGTEFSVDNTNNLSGDITIEISRSSAQQAALYFVQAIVTYTTGGGSTTFTVTYDGNGNTGGEAPTDENEYNSGDVVTVLGHGDLAKAGHAFNGWNTAADGSGTPYAKDDEFNITANTTLYAQWTAYTVTAVSNDNTLGTVSKSGFTITAEPADDCRVSKTNPYTVTDGNATITNNNDNTFTVAPTSDCTVQINFEEIPTHTATFSVDGSTTSQDYLEEADIAFPADPADSYGKTFVGWTTDAITGVSQTAPSFVTSATMGTGDVTFYAVFAEVSEGSASLTKMTSNDTFAADDKVVIVAVVDDDQYAMYQETKNSSYVNKYTFDNNVETVASDNKNWFTVSAGSNGTWKLGDATNGYVYNSSSNNLAIATNNSTEFTLAWDNENSKFTLKAGTRWLSYRSDLSNNSNDYFRMGGTGTTPNGTAYFDIYKYSASSVTYSDYCTSLTESHDLTINGYGNSTKSGWHLIASPVAVDPATVEGMVVENTDSNYEYFDLYYFDQTGGDNAMEWKNYKANAFTLVPGRGYLYANKGDVNNDPNTVTLTFTGVPYDGDGDIPLTYSEDNENENMWGWNLVGNPFAVEAEISNDYLMMNEEGSQLIPGESYIVAAMQGVFVQATGEEETVMFAPQRGGKGRGNNIVLNVSRDLGSVIDRVIVRFGDSNTLPKLQLFENSTKLCIAQDGKEYAIVNAEAQGEMPVSFRANENGQYTLTVNAEGVEMNYLHLVDNMTGTDIDLLQTPSYTFDATTSDFTSRFRLVFSASAVAENEESDQPFAFFSNGSWIVNNEGEATLQVVDMTGRLVSSESVNGTVSTTINATPGVYMLRLINGGDVRMQKVVVR